MVICYIIVFILSISLPNHVILSTEDAKGVSRPIPRTIYQSWHTKDLPASVLTKVNQMKALNPTYTHYIYTDEEIDSFVKNHYDGLVYTCFKRLGHIVDMWRYLILYKFGGIYLDMDSTITKSLDSLILDTDEAIITAETNPDVYVQWAMIFAKGHPILNKTIEIIINKIQRNENDNYIHTLTGPTVYSKAISKVFKYCFHTSLEQTTITAATNNTYICHVRSSDKEYLRNRDGKTTGNTFQFRVFGLDYNGYFEFKMAESADLYRNKNHWRSEMKQLVLPLVAAV